MDKRHSMARTALGGITLWAAALVMLLAGALHTAHAGGYGHADGYGKAQKDIIDTAVSAGNFATLASALKAADLVGTLKGPGPFTVFAPTDEAFAKIPKDRLQALLNDKAALTRVLTYHVVPGRVMASDVVKLDSVTTVQGGKLSVAAGSGVSINGAKVVKADVSASNGVIHVIDRVLIPD